eukprot:PLAT9107.1.p3 GENE.PLAT9107.1~~PLAT9107.1.p3  ORF type:complete len:172 (-),score=45.83 PLAT9107.1:173-688(-)
MLPGRPTVGASWRSQFAALLQANARGEAGATMLSAAFVDSVVFPQTATEDSLAQADCVALASVAADGGRAGDGGHLQQQAQQQQAQRSAMSIVMSDMASIVAMAICMTFVLLGCTRNMGRTARLARPQNGGRHSRRRKPAGRAVEDARSPMDEVRISLAAADAAARESKAE